MSDFVIVEEKILVYDNDQLYLMLIRFKTKYHIRVDCNYYMVGRHRAQSRREADVMFEQMAKKMDTYTDFSSAIETLELALSMRTVRECMFLVNNLNTEVELFKIMFNRKIYGYLTNKEVLDFLFQNETNDETIDITFPHANFPIGKFRPVEDEESSKFRFELNPDIFVV